jgi:uncharacterized protein YfeS
MKLEIFPKIMIESIKKKKQIDNQKQAKDNIKMEFRMIYLLLRILLKRARYQLKAILKIMKRVVMKL